MAEEAMFQIYSSEFTSVAGVEFTSIPQDYSSLEIHYHFECSTSANLKMKINNSGSSYFIKYLNPSGTGQSSASDMDLGGGGPADGDTGVLYFPGYTNTNIYKVATVYRGRGATIIAANAYAWANTNAVTELDFDISAGTMSGRITVYGVK